MKTLLVCWSAGCLGALVNSLAVWQVGQQGIARWAGVAMTPSLTPEWLYPRIVWGGIWGLLFLLPVLKLRFLLKGILLGLVPAAVQLCYTYPFETHNGMLGIRLGTWTPALVLVTYWIWGVATAVTIRYAR